MASAIQRVGVLAVLLGGTPVAHASFDCSTSHGGWRVTSSDSWTGSDKIEHFAVSAPLGALGGYLARDTAHPVIYGTLLGTVPGLAKEVVDGTCRSDGFSYKDLTADLLGALVGASFAHWAITYQRDARNTTMGVRYSSTF
jgi:putative lipoprotein